MVPFAGYELPVYYSGIIEEHRHCREHAGLFDVSHMGELWVTGKDAARFLDFALTNQLSRIQPGGAQYTFLCNANGGVEDDLIVYQLEPSRFLLVVNASNVEKDETLIRSYWTEHSSLYPDVQIENRSEETAQIALQGPDALSVLQNVVSEPELHTLKKMSFLAASSLSKGALPALIARSGYTGEDGFELYVDPETARTLWDALLKDSRVRACGLGARDTLRLEMKYPLYGQDLLATRTPLEAQLAWAVRLNKNDFVGKSALVAQKEKGHYDRWVGLHLKDRGILRAGYAVFESQETEAPIAQLTSGAFSPSLESSIATAYVPVPLATPGQELWVAVRNQRLRAEVVETPFLNHLKKG